MLKKILIGAGITVGAGLIIAATGWNFLATANMSDKFVQKTDFIAFSDCNERNHNSTQDKLDKIYNMLLEFYRDRQPVSAEIIDINIEDDYYTE